MGEGAYEERGGRQRRRGPTPGRREDAATVASAGRRHGVRGHRRPPDRVAPRRVDLLELRRGAGPPQDRGCVRQRSEGRPHRPGPPDAVLRGRSVGLRSVPRAGAQRRRLQSRRGSCRPHRAHRRELGAPDRLRARPGAPGAGRAPDRLLVRGGPDDPAGPLGRPCHDLVETVVPGARADHRGRRGRPHRGRQDRGPPRVPHRPRRLPRRRRAPAQRPRGPPAAGDRRLGRPRRDRGRGTHRPRDRRVLTRPPQRLPARGARLLRQRRARQHRPAPLRGRELARARRRHRGHPAARRRQRRAQPLQHGQ